jgi:hypothetical protein
MYSFIINKNLIDNIFTFRLCKTIEIRARRERIRTHIFNINHFTD